MRDFERGRGRLRGLPFQGRLVYSVFLCFSLLGLVFTGWLTHDMVGLNLAGLDAYYAGIPADIEPLDASADGEGPTIELAEDIELQAQPLSTRKLLEVTHFHLFSMPVYLLILSHLFMLSRASARSKTVFIGGGTIGVLLHMAAPWLAVSGGALSSVFFAGSGVLLFVTFGWMSVAPLAEMWAPASKA